MRNAQSLNSVERLRQLIDQPAQLAGSSSSTINPNGVILINDKSSQRIIMFGDIVNANHQKRHLEFLAEKNRLLVDAVGLLSPQSQE